MVARVQDDPGFRVKGTKIIEMLVGVGQAFRTGQPPVRLDRTDLAQTIAIPASNVASAEARKVQVAAE